jgi:hypothetical protein
MPSFLVFRLHLEHNAGTVIGKIDSIFLVERYADDISIPANTLVLINAIESGHRLMRIVDKGTVPAILFVISPCQIGDRSCLVVVSCLSQKEDPNSHTHCQSHNYVQKISTCQNYTEFSQLEG